MSQTVHPQVAEQMADDQAARWRPAEFPARIVAGTLSLEFAGPLPPDWEARAKALTDVSDAVREAIGGTPAGAYLLGRAEQQKEADAIAGRVAEIEAQIRGLLAEQEKTEADVASPGLGRRLADIDVKLSKLRADLARTRAAGERLAAAVEKARAPAEEAAARIASAEIAGRKQELLDRRWQLVNALAAAHPGLLEELSLVCGALNHLDTREVAMASGTFARGVARKVLSR